jgi:hypothetical protein
MKRLLFLLPVSLLLAACDGSDEGTTDEASEADTMSETGETGSELACGEEFVEKDGTTASLMDAWGAACMTDAQCEATALGAGAVCITNILGVFDLPLGYCTRECTVGTTETTFLLDSPECDPNGGVACVGIDGSFTACAPVCENDSQCGREGYGCTIMPLIGAAGDPKFCLMNADACCTADGSC